jgi:hypothetical protein
VTSLNHTIRVLSFDFDNCLFHQNYVWDSRWPNRNEVIDKKKVLLDALKASKASYKETVVLIGSNRQSKKIDADLSKYGEEPTESCFKAIKKISRYLDARLDSFLMPDIYGDLKSGQSFQDAQSFFKKKHAPCILDSSKLTLIYAQIHKLAMEYSKDKILFNFYDDKGLNTWPQPEMEKILEDLHAFFSAYPVLLPANVILQLHHYNGGKVTPYQPLRGVGFVDAGYKDTVKNMVEITMQASNIPTNFKYIERMSCIKQVTPDNIGERLPFCSKDIKYPEYEESFHFFSPFRGCFALDPAMRKTNTLP